MVDNSEYDGLLVRISDAEFKKRKAEAERVSRAKRELNPVRRLAILEGENPLEMLNKHDWINNMPKVK